MTGGSKVELRRLLTAEDARFDRAMALYGKSFPLHEQRRPAAQRAALECEDYHFDLAYDGERFVGMILYWETSDFYYVEHFCIEPELRSCGYGQSILSGLRGRGKTVLLEIDPPVDEISVRRQGFYERAGYHANPYPHVHPPYHPEHQGHSLVVMSCPRPICQGEYDAFIACLRERVMAKAR